METNYVVVWGERVYGPFEFGEALVWVDNHARDRRELRMAKVRRIESPSVLG